jgi:hypothetical protein
VTILTHFHFRVAHNTGLSSWINTAPLASIYPFGWQDASATVASMKSPNRFKVGAYTDVVQVIPRVLNLESVPRPVWDAKALRYIIGGLVVAGHRFRGRPSKIVVQHLSQCPVAV